MTTADGKRPRRTAAAARSNRGLWWALAAIIGALVLLVAGVLWHLSRAPGEEGSLVRTDADVENLSGTRGVVLVFPNRDATGTVTEERQLPSRSRMDEDLLAVVRALAEGPRTGSGVSALPEGTEIKSAFYDPQARSAVIDFSRELVTAHPGGSASEHATLASILTTVGINFPEIETCTLLVDGAQVETLAGHYGMESPFELRRWR